MNTKLKFVGLFMLVLFCHYSFGQTNTNTVASRDPNAELARLAKESAAKAAINLTNNFSKWPVPQGNILGFFAYSSDDQIMELLKGNPSLIEEEDDMQCTVLHYSARFGRFEAVKWLLDHKANVNTVAYNNFTPMHVVTNGAVAELLIKAGADLNKRDSWGKTPLQSAAEMGYTNVCEAILASGFPIDLGSALRLGKRDMAKKIIQEHPDVVKQVEEDSDLWANTSPLGIAALNGDKEMVELLLKAGAPINAPTERPNEGILTPLCNAVWANHYEIAEMLCEAGADCNVSGGRQNPRLLDYAKKYSDQKMVDLLVKFGAKESGTR
jgi:ankyrin repeat protein